MLCAVKLTVACSEKLLHSSGGPQVAGISESHAVKVGVAVVSFKLTIIQDARSQCYCDHDNNASRR